MLVHGRRCAPRRTIAEFCVQLTQGQHLVLSDCGAGAPNRAVGSGRGDGTSSKGGCSGRGRVQRARVQRAAGWHGPSGSSRVCVAAVGWCSGHGTRGAERVGGRRSWAAAPPAARAVPSAASWAAPPLPCILPPIEHIRSASSSQQRAHSRCPAPGPLASRGLRGGGRPAPCAGRCWRRWAAAQPPPAHSARSPFLERLLSEHLRLLSC